MKNIYTMSLIILLVSLMTFSMVMGLPNNKPDECEKGEKINVCTFVTCEDGTHFSICGNERMVEKRIAKVCGKK